MNQLICVAIIFCLLHLVVEHTEMHKHTELWFTVFLLNFLCASCFSSPSSPPVLSPPPFPFLSMLQIRYDRKYCPCNGDSGHSASVSLNHAHTHCTCARLELSPSESRSFCFSASCPSWTSDHYHGLTVGAVKRRLLLTDQQSLIRKTIQTNLLCWLYGSVI